MKHSIVIAMPLLVLCGGCRSVDRRTPTSQTPTLVYTTPSDKELRHRVTELERAGHSKENAERKARTEFANDAWGYEASESWASVKRRTERSATREKMEKDLTQLDEWP